MRGAGLYQIDLLNGSKERVSEAEVFRRAAGPKETSTVRNAALTAAGQPSPAEEV